MVSAAPSDGHLLVASMSGRLLAVQTALLSLLFPYMPGMKQSCPWLVNEPVMRADVEPHDLITRLQQEVQQLDHADVS